MLTDKTESGPPLSAQSVELVERIERFHVGDLVAAAITTHMVDPALDALELLIQLAGITLDEPHALIDIRKKILTGRVEVYKRLAEAGLWGRPIESQKMDESVQGSEEVTCNLSELAQSIAAGLRDLIIKKKDIHVQHETRTQRTVTTYQPYIGELVQLLLESAVIASPKSVGMAVTVDEHKWPSSKDGAAGFLGLTIADQGSPPNRELMQALNEGKPHKLGVLTGRERVLHAVMLHGANIGAGMHIEANGKGTQVTLEVPFTEADEPTEKTHI